MAKNNGFSQKITVFHDFPLPEPEAALAGYAALIEIHQLRVPLPDFLCAISRDHKHYEKGRWRMFTVRHKPENGLLDQLTFALKYEGVDLAILNALFKLLPVDQIKAAILTKPTGSYSRRIWFLYEWLLQTKLDLPDLTHGNFVDIIDDNLQYSGPAVNIKRQRVRNNLPGVVDFCPLIRKTEKLEAYIQSNLAEKIKQNLSTISIDILHRAAAFLLLKDSKASYAIEGEKPSQSRAERWAQAISQAGMHPLSHEEFLRLQEMVIVDFRFVHFGYRCEGGFIGEHERDTAYPMPVHISARWQDIENLMEGLLKTANLLTESDFDAVLLAAMIAFGFVFIHPLEDGNGRIHRYLMHHMLAAKHFTSLGIIFPVSAAILKNIIQYRTVLEAYSKPRLSFIQWRATEKGNVDVLNETMDLYRYFDATKQAEFLYDCVLETIESIIPEEVKYLQNYDRMKQFIDSYLELPDRLGDLLIRFLNQEQGRLSKRARSKEFSSLTEAEVKMIEDKFAEIFL